MYISVEALLHLIEKMQEEIDPSELEYHAALDAVKEKVLGVVRGMQQ